MKKQLQLLFLSVVLVALSSQAFGIIAYPYPVEITQPDGTKITIILKGDEHVKWAETLDGYSILRNSKGIYEYAVINANNDMVPSGIPVKNQSNRSAVESQFLNGINKGLVYSKSQIDLMTKVSKIYQNEKEKVFPTTGSRKLVCVLMGFTDVAFTKTKADFENLFNQAGYNVDGATGSVYDFYKENSFNQLDLTVTVAGPYTASNNMAYYGGNDASGNDLRPRQLVTEAVNLADPALNYADFDNDNDGTVDGVYVIYAGYGEEYSGVSANAIWAHAWSITPVTLDGKVISRYSCSSELRGNSGTGLTRIGVICHEFGHVMGASDYYDTDYATNGSYTGTGTWDLMAGGSWNNSGATPAHHNPYTKIYSYGWATATTLTSSTSANITLNDAESYSNSFYRLNTVRSNEYFLIENRQQHKFDTNIPGHGMIIYHVDGNYISTAGNRINAGSHQGMYPVNANASGNPPTTYGTINSAGLPFPGTSSRTSFTDATTPHSHCWEGFNTNKPVTGITENTVDKTVSFSYVVNTAAPAAVTLDASILTPSSAALNAKVSANNSPTTITFEYGLTTSYGTTVNATPNTVSGENITNVTASLTGLTPNTTYNYRVKAVNSIGTTYGSNMTFNPVVMNLPMTESFATATLPAGWSTQNIGTNVTERWSLSNTSIAGGTPYELKCSYQVYGNLPGTTRVITPALNTVGEAGLTLSFKHMFDDYAVGSVLRVQTSTDKVTWTNEDWSFSSGAGNAGPVTVTTTISHNLDSPNTYVAFVIDGDLSYPFDYWYIDDVSIKSSRPSVTTAPVTTVSSTAVNSGGNVTDNGGNEVTERGICWSTAASPTVALSTKTVDGTGNGVFTSSITGLTSGVAYHLRAYATSSAGTGYGEEIQFTLGTIVSPALTTLPVSDISSSTATGGGNITFDGCGAITAKGVCWSTLSNPTVALSTKTTDGTGIDGFTSFLTGLASSTTYHVRAYATNSSGTGYGPDVTFTTLAAIYNMNNEPVTTCSGVFYDSGGETGNYQNYEDFTKVFTPGSPGNKLSFTFTSFAIESCCDNLYIYDGPNTSSPQFPGSPFRGSAVIGTVTASALNTTGAITFRFTSDLSVVGTGWAANISCISVPTTSTVSTSPVTSIGSTTAVSGGEVTFEGNVNVTARGVCWSTSANPTVELSTKTVDGTGLGAFTSSLTGLTPGTIYHVRAYATNSAGTGYGDDLQFTTLTVPTLTTTPISAITLISASSGGNITATGGSPVIARGVCWGTSINPTIALATKTSNGTGTGTFTSSITGLSAGVTYHVRAYATNVVGTAYGDDIQFTTCSVAVIPTLTTQALSEITLNSAISGGEISSTGCSAITARGVCWSTTSNPTIALSTKTTDGSGEGSFISNITGLSPGVVYHVRAYATNSIGTGYGADIPFTTCTVTTLATISTTAVSGITSISAICGGIITSSGCATVTSRGVCWSTAVNPTTALTTKTTDGTGEGVFTSNITGLAGGTTYHVRAYATNVSGTAYGDDISFTTPAPAPVATAGTNILQTGFTANWNSSVTATGYRLDVSTEITFATFVSGNNNRDIGNILTATVTGLTSNTTYYYRVRAYGAAGTSINSNIITVQTLPGIPAAPVATAASGITQTGFSANWNTSAVASGYRLDLSTSSSFTVLITGYNNLDVGNVTSTNITGLTANTLYYYRLRAYNVTGTSTNSNTISTTTLINPPSAPVPTSATNITQNSFSANWNSTSTATGYQLDVSTNNSFSTFISGYNNRNAGNVTSVSVTGLSSNTIYYYRVRAINSGGTSINSSTTSATTLPEIPTAPTANSATGIVQTSFTAAWSSAVRATGYRLDVATNSGFTTLVTGYNNKDIGNLLSTSVTGLSAKTTYYYRVKAYNSGGTGVASNVVTLTTLTIPPASPSTLTVLSCNNLATLKWRKNPDPYVSKYRIYGGLSESPTTKLDSTNGITDTLKVLSGLIHGRTYYFRVTAVNYDGPESPFSNQPSATIKTGVIPKIKAKWGDVLICSNLGDSLVSYKWYKGTSPIANATNQYYVTNKQPGIYNVQTIDLNGCVNSSNTISSSGTKSLSVYPNPASVSFALKLNDVYESKAVVSILTSAGIKVMEFRIENANDDLLKEIPVNNLDEGTYIVQVLLDNKDLFYTKIIVMK